MKPLAKTKGQTLNGMLIERAGEKLGIRLPAEYVPQAALEIPKIKKGVKIKKGEWQWFLLTEGGLSKKGLPT